MTSTIKRRIIEIKTEAIVNAVRQWQDDSSMPDYDTLRSYIKVVVAEME